MNGVGVLGLSQQVLRMKHRGPQYSQHRRGFQDIFFKNLPLLAREKSREVFFHLRYQALFIFAQTLPLPRAYSL